MNLKKTLIGLVAATLLTGSLFAQNKTSKETKMGKSMVVYFSLAGDQNKKARPALKADIDITAYDSRIALQCLPSFTP